MGGERVASSPWRALSVASLIGLDLAVCTVIGYWLGKGADRWLGTDPILMIVGLLMGLAAGLTTILPIVRKFL